MKQKLNPKHFRYPKKHALGLLLFFLATQLALSQQKFTLNGYVKDAENGEELIGVTVYVKELKTGSATNVYGFYALSLPVGEYNITYSSIGYQPVVQTVLLNADLEMNVELPVLITQMDEIVVTDKAIDANVTDIKMSRNEINVKQVKRLPALFGEPDIIKTIQMLPGVASAGEGTSSFFVRGGSADQNLILIDEAPIYDPSHLFGLFSVFNADVIKESELYKGGIPSRFGGRLSSILEVRTKDGNNKKFTGNGGIGSLASRVMLEGPIKKDKSSFILSARRSYVDVFLKAAGEENSVHFYDVNAKVNWKHNNNNRFFAALYLGRDVFDFDDTFGFDWGNATATFRWNHLFNSKLFSNTTLIASNFDYKMELDDDAQGFEWTSNIRELTFKEDLNYFLNPSNEFNFGYHISYRSFDPGVIKPSSDKSLFTRTELQEEFALDHAFYADHQLKVSNKLTFLYGARLSIFQSIGKSDVYLYENPTDNIDVVRTDTLSYDRFENIKTFVNFEPRFSARYIVNPRSSVKVSYNRMVQNTHLISAGTVPIPFNTWAPTSYYLDPQLADQVAAGYFRNLKDNAYELSAEVYYKDIDNVTDFADNARIFFNQDLSTEYRQGDSWSYGLELMLKKNEGKFTGFTSYTWSRTERKIPGVNIDQPFLANYDRRHNFNIVGTYEYNDKWVFGANFTYTTGRPITLPSGKYEFEGYQVDLISERNGFQLPDYHRLDLSATLTPRKNKGKKLQGSWVFSIYNAYSRKNAFTIYTQNKEDADENPIRNEKEARLIYLFPILPSVTYNVKF
ncbi:TonB-dependent receptor [Fulvivirga sp. M361]|uniref:TonB-dependent receptor n=1 Tax=Fulvivirga sp. M361 TaxID=2594266 RepID=UPI00117B17EB|nr:TonB-dependent receptor [Fulvivirga sp. M361]TRX52407.1 TonB-dependent receptor [Fulvivirga sp. M361]